MTPYLPRTWLPLAPALLLLGTACLKRPAFDPDNPAVGPGAMVGNGAVIHSGPFTGGDDTLPAARAGAPAIDPNRPPDCDADCVAYCEAQNLTNPVNRGLCRGLWGVGLAHAPIDREEACRRLFVDMKGRLPTPDEAQQVCAGGFGAAVQQLLDDPAFVTVNQRRAADRFLYSTEVVSVQSIYDFDNLVGKLHRGLVPYDLFAAVATAHPVVTRRYADARDMAEAVFRLFMGRPPFENERADLGRLFALWHRGYYDHSVLNLRLPDAFVRYRCLDENNQVDPERRGECTSVLWGYREVVLTPDIRATMERTNNQEFLTMWHGLLSGEEWTKLQAPGKALATDPAFWERAVDEVLEQYLGYSLGTLVPAVRQELVAWLLTHGGDIRSVHHAVATSIAYLQTANGTSSAAYRWTYGPLKQFEAERWIDSMSTLASFDVDRCDHRITTPEAFLEAGSIAAYQLLDRSGWRLGDDGEVDARYSSMARTLGGCPENVVGGRFKVISILTTATQLSFVGQLCNPTLQDSDSAAPAAQLLPDTIGPTRAVNGDLAVEIATHQYRKFLGRTPTLEESQVVQSAGSQCALNLCTAEEFARPMCFALLSSAQMLFY